MITQTHRLDVVPGGITTVVHVKQYQTDESLVFDLFSRFGDFEISANFTECTVRGTKSDGNGYSANATCDPSNNSVTVQLTEQMTAVAGRQPYELTVTDSTGRMITTTFILDVHRAALDADTVESESVIKEVQTIVEEYIEENPGLFVVDPTLTQSGEAADAKVTGAEINALKSAIENETVLLDFTENTYIDKNNGEIKPYNGWKTSSPVDVSGADVLYITATGASQYNALYGENDNFISAFTVMTGFSALPIVDGAKYARFSGSNANMNGLHVLAGSTVELSKAKSQTQYTCRNMMDTWFSVGGISNSTGGYTDTSARWRSDYIQLEGGHWYSVDLPYQFVMYEYTGQPGAYTYRGLLVPLYTNECYIDRDVTVIVVLKHTDDGSHGESSATGMRRLYKSINLGEAVNSVGCLPVLNYRAATLNNYGNESESTTRLSTDYLPIGGSSYVEVVANGQKYAICLYDSNKTFLYNSGWLYQGMKIMGGGSFTRIVVAKTDDGAITTETNSTEISSYEKTVANAAEGFESGEGTHYTPFSKTVKTIMHRGANSIAPENTIPAFKLARRMGFTTIECDIQLTSDLKCVILHDATVDRTSNGTGTIYEMPFSTVRALDFGSYKSAEYAGTTIPTFEETLSLCKNIGMEIYVEIKRESPWTQELITQQVTLAKKYGMFKHITWVSFNQTCLTYVKNADPKARLGLVDTTISAEDIEKCLSLRSESNEVIAISRHDTVTDAIVNSLLENEIPLCVYTVDSEADADAFNPYATETMSNVGNTGKYLYNKSI